MANGKNGACCFGKSNPHAWGLILILIGAYFLAEDLGWVPSGIPFWPIAFIAFGLYMLPSKH